MSCPTSRTPCLPFPADSTSPSQPAYPPPIFPQEPTANTLLPPNTVGSLLTAFQESTALTLLSPTFTDTSSSINFLSSNPAMNGPTFPTRDAFIAGQGSQPPIGFEVLGIDAVSCLADPAHSPSGTATGVVVFRWLAEVGGRQTGGSKGINVLYVKEASGEGEGVGGWVIETVFSEFNSAVWVKEFGGDCKAPSPPPSPASGKGRLFRA